ncbi:MAG TPA: DUF255 domain-containing protein [Thermoanaerobaculia bacterium]|jgi:uncharacterized protein YyaL (SSP411 family)
MKSPVRGKVLIGLLFPALIAARLEASAPQQIRWEGWSDAAFVRAQAEKRLVILDLVAVWCHWCHVMEETTYKDPEVVRAIGEHFVALRVDQDSRPDLSNRYEDYGWPATVVFDANGRELVKFAGYIPPERMRTLLRGVVADPTPGPSVTESPLTPDPSPAGRGESRSPALSERQRKDLLALLAQRYDKEQGGWGFAKKFLDFDAVEWCLARAREGDADSERMARETLTLSRRLIDPVWGGLYQYSDSGDWDHPHFEKLLQFQAEGIRLYALAYAQWRDERDLQAARDILRYVRAFLKSPEGAFYVSQDADLVAGEHSAEYYALDDAGRRARGIPRVDTHLYARENAWMVQALVSLYAVTNDPAILAEAVTAANWILAQRPLPAGGYRHDAVDAAGPYLGDSVAAGRAFLALWSVTGDRPWLTRSRNAASFVEGFAVEGDSSPGLVSASPRGRFAPPRPQRDENVAVARWGNLLFRYTGDDAYRRLADRAMAFLVIPEVAQKFSTASVLLADRERSSEPPHLTVVGSREDAGARRLLAAAVADPGAYKRVELFDERDGALSNLDVEFPRLDRPAAFVCANGRCSLPAYTPEELEKRIARLRASASSPLNP